MCAFIEPLFSYCSLENLYQEFQQDCYVRGLSPNTLIIYHYTAGRFANWCEEREISSRTLQRKHVRAYLAEIKLKGYKPWTLHAHARAIRTMLRFGYAEGIIEQEIKVPMPIIPKSNPKYLRTNKEKQAILDACLEIRDKAIISIMIESGLRKAEVVALNWGDLEWKEDQ